MIYKLACNRDEDDEDMNGEANDREGAVLQVWEGYFKELLNLE